MPGTLVPMAMTIKNERVLAKIRNLADDLDVDQVTAIESAVDALARSRPTSVSEEHLARVLTVARQIRESAPSDFVWDADELYDEFGLPR